MLSTDQKFHVKKVNEMTADDTLTLNGAAVFAGSYISVYHPSSVLSGLLFCQRMYSYLFDWEMETDPNLYTEYAKIPFEALMELCPNKTKALRAITGIYGQKPANSIHEVLASLLERKEIASLTTPNYDTCIDSCLNGNNPAIVAEEDLNETLDKFAHSPYFKIHGTAAPGKEDTIVFTLSQEGSLEEWKKNLLIQLISERTVLFLAYSGRDFDICPLIAQRIKYQKIYWLHFSDRFNNSLITPENLPELLNELSPYAKFLLESNPENILVVGDIVQLLNRVYAANISGISRGVFDFVPHKEFGMTAEELLEWRFRVVDRLGYAHLGKKMLRQYRNLLPAAFYLKMKSAFLAHQGRYRDATRISLALAESPEHTGPDRTNALIAAAAINIPLGKYALSSRLLKVLERQLKSSPVDNMPELNAEFVRVNFAFWMRLFQVSAKLPPLFLVTYLLKRKATRLYHHAFQQLSSSGSWDDRQMLQHNAERLNIPTAQTNISLPSSVGFVNLGMPNMDIIRFRDSIRFGNKAQRQVALLKIDEFIQRANYLGIKTEVWKLSRLKFLQKKLTHEEQLQTLKLWRSYLKTTQYICMLKSFYWLEFKSCDLFFKIKTAWPISRLKH